MRPYNERGFFVSAIVQLAAAKERRHIFQQAQLYQSFGSVEIMDEHVKRHISRCSYLSPGTLRILNHLSGHSCKIPGVSFGRVAYIASETGLTERTVQIALKKLEKEGIIKRLPSIGLDGRRNVNLIVIQPSEAADPEQLNDHGIATDDGSDFTPPESVDLKLDAASCRVNERRNYFKLEIQKNDESNIDISTFIDFASDYQMPEQICLEIAKSLRQQLDPRELACNPNDLRNSFRRATSRFVSLYRNAYHISSNSSFYIHLFRKELRRCKDLRAAV